MWRPTQQVLGGDVSGLSGKSLERLPVPPTLAYLILRSVELPSADRGSERNPLGGTARQHWSGGVLAVAYGVAILALGKLNTVDLIDRVIRLSPYTPWLMHHVSSLLSLY